jgi:UDP-N-acetyl-2-amino-2-deoxyglucuronate dehydrogenase
MLIEPTKEQPLIWYTTKGDDAGKLQTPGGLQAPRGYHPFVSQAVRACAEMSDPPISSQHSLRALRTVFAIYAAAETGRSTKVAGAV